MNLQKQKIRENLRENRKVFHAKTGSISAQKLADQADILINYILQFKFHSNALSALNSVVGKVSSDSKGQTQNRLSNLMIAGYYPIASEISPILLMQALEQKGAHLALPVIETLKTSNSSVRYQKANSNCQKFTQTGSALNQDYQEKKLTYRLWRAGMDVIKGSFKTYQPGNQMKQVCPNVLLVPLLAFDRFGNRLGQGGGFYDKSIQELRSKLSFFQKEICVIGIAFSSQAYSCFPVEEHDEKLDAVLTEEELVRFTHKA